MKRLAASLTVLTLLALSLVALALVMLVTAAPELLSYMVIAVPVMLMLLHYILAAANTHDTANARAATTHALLGLMWTLISVTLFTLKVVSVWIKLLR